MGLKHVHHVHHLINLFEYVKTILVYILDYATLKRKYTSQRKDLVYADCNMS